jgi:hypothetical protein
MSGFNLFDPSSYGSLFGNSSQPGPLGTGMYQAPNYTIDQNATNNPGYTPGQYNNQAANYLGNTTGVGGIQQGQQAAAQAAGGNYGNFNTGIQGQLGLANQYGQMAAGNGPSLATVQAQQQGAQNLAQANSMLGSARGSGNPAAAQLASQNAMTQGQQQVAQNAVAGRTQEELGAMNAQAGLYGNVAQQGLGQVGAQQQNAQFNANQQNQLGQANQANNLAANTNFLGSTGNMALAQQQGGLAGQQLGVQQQLGLGQIGSGAYQSAAANNKSLAGGIIGGLGSIAGIL